MESPTPRTVDDDLTLIRTIRADIVNDAKALDGTPFTGRGVAETFGTLMAVVEALAGIVEHELARQMADAR